MLTKDQKNLLKDLSKKLLKDQSNDKINIKNLLNFFVREEDGTSGTNVYIFEGLNIGDVITELDKYINIDGVSFNSPYDCTGRYFSHPIKEIILEKANRIVITQDWVYDV